MKWTSVILNGKQPTGMCVPETIVQPNKTTAIYQTVNIQSLQGNQSMKNKLKTKQHRQIKQTHRTSAFILENKRFFPSMVSIYGALTCIILLTLAVAENPQNTNPPKVPFKLLVVHQIMIDQHKYILP
jgi:hypothetical protein